MVKTEDLVDPKVEKRRQKNKVASAKCRERKLKRAQLLQQEVTKMRTNVEVKKENVKKLKDKIESVKQYLEAHSDFLTDEEKKRFQELVNKSQEKPEVPKMDLDIDLPTASLAQTLVDTGQIHMKHHLPETLHDSGNDTSGDDDYKPTYDDVSSPEKEMLKMGPPKKRKYIRRDFRID